MSRMLTTSNGTAVPICALMTPLRSLSSSKAAGTMSEAAYRGVQNATDSLSKNKHGEEIEKLSKMAESGNDFEKAVVNYNLGFAYSSKNDYENATAAFARALALNSLPQSQHDQLQLKINIQRPGQADQHPRSEHRDSG